MESNHNCQLCKNRSKSVFSDLSPESNDEVDQLKTCVFFKKGQIILQEGARPQGVFCLHNGKVKIYQLGNEGKEQIIRFATNGDLIGYRSVLSDEVLSASIKAMEDTHACYIPKSSFFKVIEANPKFSLNVLKLSCHELGEAGKIITSLAQKNVKERLAEIFLVLLATFGADEEGYINIKLTREEIANMVGTATESAIRLISTMKKDELIETQGRRIKVLNKKLMRQEAQILH